jgi:hypothetical protein
MAKPPPTGSTKFKTHLLADDRGAGGKAWCGQPFGRHHKIAANLNFVSCSRCRALRDSALAEENRES